MLSYREVHVLTFYSLLQAGIKFTLQNGRYCVCCRYDLFQVFNSSFLDIQMSPRILKYVLLQKRGLKLESNAYESIYFACNISSRTGTAIEIFRSKYLLSFENGYRNYCQNMYVGMLLCLGFSYFLFSYLQHNQNNFSWMG
jgi:hypothetical protein